VRRREEQLLGPFTATLDAVDVPTARLLLGTDEKVGVGAVLLTERAKLLDARGDHRAAQSVARRALALFQLLEANGYVSSEPERGSVRRSTAFRGVNR
jgi:hypothetical protein